ncbi:MAG TPA: ATP-binding cassette domain-containing protein, partial [Chitinophagaceae bacterium]|nr:ATP-binding cassette domain-containing protein [Chitinophagaceae bacterium]
TLLRIIAGAESFEGQRKWGHNVEASFYAQHQLEALNLNHTILDEMMICGSQKTELELRSLLGCFLFSGEDADKRIKVLSGGEKARVALAKTIVSKANFLMLDEPTNHLDMHSCDLLIEALNKYEGSFILVSHDRYFISKTANRIWEIVDHEIRDFKGGYEEWVEWKERMQQQQKQKQEQKIIPVEMPSNAKKEPENTPVPNQAATPNVPINKELKKEYQKQQKAFQQLEARLAQVQEKKGTLEGMLGNPQIYADKDKFVQTENEYKTISQELIRLNREYEQAFEKMMELEASMDAVNK